MKDLSKKIDDQLVLAERLRKWRLRALGISVIPALVAGCIASAIHPHPTAFVLAFSVFAFSFVIITVLIRRHEPKCPGCGASWAALSSPICRWQHCPGCGTRIRDESKRSSNSRCNRPAGRP